MMGIDSEILLHLKPLIGLKLSVARRAADLRNFQFGEIRPIPKGTVGEYALHIQCPWRIEGPFGIVTGSSDLWMPAVIEPDFDQDTWNFDTSENLQDRRLAELLKGYDPDTRSLVNQTENLVVQSISADAYGSVIIVLSGGYKLVLFHAGTDGEDWRVFRPAIDESHFVISGGRIDAEA